VIWLPVLAWAVGVAVALVVLGFAGYELWWKADRLRGDLRRLLALRETLQGMQTQLVEVQKRLPRPGAR
jgi:hypothetical protein